MAVKVRVYPGEEAARKRLVDLERCPTNYGHRINFQNHAKGDLNSAFAEIDRLRKLLTKGDNGGSIQKARRSKRPAREESVTHE
jgi:hypothetical protein